jgi:UDP-N-acetylglucosamine--N-acetylmuramyl-(pentapeptide) pyrophosphoryl-undecaprenol N-acetylglucosamine transferase
VFVPLPHGNGEQAFNAKPVVDIGGALMVDDADLTPAKVLELLVPILTDRRRTAAMSTAAQGSGHRVADETLARMVLEAVRK